MSTFAPACPDRSPDCARVPLGTLQGVVLEALTGAPIEGAQVFVRGTGHGVSSAPDGTFRLDSLHQGVRHVVVRRLGFRTDSVSVNGASSTTDAMTVLALHADRVIVCDDPVGPQPLVLVRVRALPSGDRPAAGVSLRVRAGALLDSGHVELATDTLLLFGALYTHPESRVVDVAITAPGYHPWTQRGIRLPIRSCGGFRERALDAWLIPR